MKKRVFYASTVFGLAIMIIYVLHLISVLDIYFKKHGFTRRFFSEQPVRIGLDELGLPFDQILVKKGRIYIYQMESAYFSVRNSENGSVLNFRRLTLDYSCTTFSPFISFAADGDTIHFFAPSDSLVLSYHPVSDRVTCFKTPFLFDRGMVHLGHFYFKMVNPDNRHSIIRRCDSLWNCRVVYTVDTVDNGGLPTDGMFEESGNELLFTFYFRNEYLLMRGDSVRSYPAISTDTSQIAVAATSSGTYSFSGPVRAKNARISASGGRLYVHSLTVSDNESRTAFRDHVLIDSYDLATQRYLGSLSIPKEVEGEPMKDFSVEGGKIYALHGRFLSVYQIPGLS